MDDYLNGFFWINLIPFYEINLIPLLYLLHLQNHQHFHFLSRIIFSLFRTTIHPYLHHFCFYNFQPFSFILNYQHENMFVLVYEYSLVFALE